MNTRLPATVRTVQLSSGAHVASLVPDAERGLSHDAEGESPMAASLGLATGLIAAGREIIEHHAGHPSTDDIERALDQLLDLHRKMVGARIDASACGTSTDFANHRKAEDLFLAGKDAFKARLAVLVAAGERGRLLARGVGELARLAR